MQKLYLFLGKLLLPMDDICFACSIKSTDSFVLNVKTRLKSKFIDTWEPQMSSTGSNNKHSVGQPTSKYGVTADDFYWTVKKVSC